jgi:tetratricopeptide (TPR) repeat protein
MSNPDSSQPIAQGDLAKTPFAHLVLYLHRQALSGTLVINRGGFETKILFRNGRAVAARPLPRGTALSSGLLELCAVDAAAYAFWDGDLLGDASGVIQGTVDPFMFVSESLRGHTRESNVAAVVDRYRGVALRAVPEADPKRFGIRGAEARALERLRDYATTPEEFHTRVELSQDDARRLLYMFLITRQVLPEGGELPSASGVRAAVDADAPLRVSSVPPPNAASSQPPRGATSTPPAQSRRPSGASHARVTPQPFSVPPSMVPKAPSSQPSPGGASRPPMVARASLPAWQQLASMRAASRSTPSTPIAIPSLAPPVESLEPEGKLKRAEKLAERRSFDEASRIVDDLIAHDALNADYHAMRAWIQYQQFTGNQPPQKLLEPIERALRCDEQHPRALYIKGLVLKRMGKEVEALRFFQRTLDADPRHIEAQRELRLARMRRER